MKSHAGAFQFLILLPSFTWTANTAWRYFDGISDRYPHECSLRGRTERFPWKDWLICNAHFNASRFLIVPDYWYAHSPTSQSPKVPNVAHQILPSTHSPFDLQTFYSPVLLGCSSRILPMQKTSWMSPVQYSVAISWGSGDEKKTPRGLYVALKDARSAGDNKTSKIFLDTALQCISLPPLAKGVIILVRAQKQEQYSAFDQLPVPLRKDFTWSLADIISNFNIKIVLEKFSRR